MDYFEIYKNELIILLSITLILIVLANKLMKEKDSKNMVYLILGIVTGVVFIIAPIVFNSEISQKQYISLLEIKNKSSICLIKKYSDNGINHLEYSLIKDNEKLIMKNKLLKMINNKKEICDKK